MWARTVATAARSSIPALRMSRATRSTSFRSTEWTASASAHVSRICTATRRSCRASARDARVRAIVRVERPTSRCDSAHAATARSNSSEKSGLLACTIKDRSSLREAGIVLPGFRRKRRARRRSKLRSTRGKQSTESVKARPWTFVQPFVQTAATRRRRRAASPLADERDLPIATLEERLVFHESPVVHHALALREQVHEAELVPVEHEDVAVRADLEPPLPRELEHLGGVARDERE